VSPEEIDSILQAYGTVVLEQREFLCDAAKLPFPKSLIKQALLAAIRASPPGDARESLKSSYVTIADWQDLTDPNAAAAEMAAEAKSLLEELRTLRL